MPEIHHYTHCCVTIFFNHLVGEYLSSSTKATQDYCRQNEINELTSGEWNKVEHNTYFVYLFSLFLLSLPPSLSLSLSLSLPLSLSSLTHSLSLILQTVAANRCGELQLRLETDIVSATTYFKDLQNHIFGEFISLQHTTMTQP